MLPWQPHRACIPRFYAKTLSRACVHSHCNTARYNARRPLMLPCCAQPGGDKDESVEALFAKELMRRGLSLDSQDEGDAMPASKPASQSGQGPSSVKDPFASSSTTTKPRAPPPMSAMSPPAADDQRQKSIALVNEGLEGLIPRASELLKLGGTFFLAFAPLILVVSLAFGGIYMVFGDAFVHGGRENAGPPPYVDPERLLSSPTVDPYVPYR